MYRAAETDAAWHRVAEMGWRVTHHQPIQRPDPAGLHKAPVGGGVTDSAEDDPTGLLRLSAACHASSLAQWARAMGELLAALYLNSNREDRCSGVMDGILCLQGGGAGAMSALRGAQDAASDEMVTDECVKFTRIGVAAALFALSSRRSSRRRPSLSPDQENPLLKMQDAVASARRDAHDAKIAAAVKTATQAALRVAQAAGVDARAVFQEAWRLA